MEPSSTRTDHADDWQLDSTFDLLKEGHGRGQASQFDRLIQFKTIRSGFFRGHRVGDRGNAHFNFDSVQ